MITVDRAFLLEVLGALEAASGHDAFCRTKLDRFCFSSHDREKIGAVLVKCRKIGLPVFEKFVPGEYLIEAVARGGFGAKK